MKRLFTPVTSVLLVIAASCGIGPTVDDYNDSLVAAALAGCPCGHIGYSSEDECRAEAPPTAAEQACIEALFKNVEGDYEAHLDCRAAVNNRFASCLNAKTCTDAARLGCGLDYADEIEDCPDLPADVEQELAECRT